jgi:hypothetical protein
MTFMKKIFYLIITSQLLIASCKQDKSIDNNPPKVEVSSPDPNFGKPATTSSAIDTATLIIPDPCKLITAAEVKAIFKSGADVNFNPGSEGATNDKSCFFRVEDKKPNGAILIQISTNPLPAEISDYPVKIIEGKMTQGEQNPTDNKAAVYTSLPALGDMGCYNYAMGKYHWQFNKDYLFLIAFNTTHSEKDQKAIAIEVAKIINKNFQSSINTK